MENMRELSKQNFNTGNKTIEAINCGSLQRIADATELMAGNYIALQNDLIMYKRWYNEEKKCKAELHRKITALKGVITKLKNKAKC